MKPFSSIPLITIILTHSLSGEAQQESLLPPLQIQTPHTQEYLREETAPILPQLGFPRNPYTEIQRPFPQAPVAPQYILDPHTNQYRRIL
jgi:hypothetical protein